MLRFILSRYFERCLLSFQFLVRRLYSQANIAMEVGAFFFICVSVASFLNGSSESCFVMLITALCLSTSVSFQSGDLQGRLFFIAGWGEVWWFFHGRKGTMVRSGVLITCIVRIRMLVSLRASQLDKLWSINIPAFFFDNFFCPEHCTIG